MDDFSSSEDVYKAFVENRSDIAGLLAFALIEQKKFFYLNKFRENNQKEPPAN